MEIVELTPAKKEVNDTIENNIVELSPPKNIAKTSDQFNETPQEDVSFAKGATGSLLQGGTFGFSDEVQSLIAATIASPFVSDKTFSQLMIDARNSLRDENKNFKENNPKTALGLELVGGIATGSTLFKGAQTTAQMAKAGGVLGAAGGAGLSDSEELISLDTAMDAAIGGAGGAILGAALPLAAKSISKGIKSFIGKPEIQIFNDAGQFTDEAINALDDMVRSGRASADDVDTLIRSQLQKDGVLTPEQAQRFNLFVRRGVTPTRANVTQSGDDFIAQQEAAKRSGAVSETIANQDQQLTNLVDTSIENIRPRATNIVETNANVFSVVDDVVNVFDDQVSKAYKTARIEAKGQPRIVLSNLAEAVSNNRGQENISGGVMSAVRQMLKNKGINKIDSYINIDRGTTRTVGEDLKKLTVEQAEEVRQGLNGLWDSATPQGKRIIINLKNAIDDDVAGAVGDDIFRDARLAKVRFQELIEKTSRNKFDKSKGGFLEDVIYNKIPEEKILPRLLNGRDDDFIKMKQFLTQDAGEPGVQAFNDIKAQVLRNALDKATGTMGKGEGGQAVFNSRLFKNELNKLRNSKKFTELFNNDEIQLIDDIIELGQLRVPKSGTQSGKGPSAVAIEGAANAIIKRIPLIGDKAVELTQALKNISTDKRLLNVTRETQAALSK